MAFKTVAFVFLLVATLMVVAVPIAEAQLGLGSVVGNILGLIHISGTVFCTSNGNAATGGASTPVFANATVQMVCGTVSSVVQAVTTTNSLGIFTIFLNPLQFLLSSLLSECKLLVLTPLSACNPSLSSFTGILASPLQLIGTTISGFLSIINLIPAGFNLVN